MRRSTLSAAVLAAVFACAGAAAQHDPNLEPGSPGQPAPTSATTPTPSPAQSPTSPPHPATVKTHVDPDSPTMTAPPPGWQLVRPVILSGKLYYAVADAEKYLAQAGWTRPAVVHKKEDTGFRFDLIEVPASIAGSVVRRSYVGRGVSIGLDTGHGYGISYGPAGGPWVGRDYNTYVTGGYAGPIDGQLSPGYVPTPPQEPEEVVLNRVEQAGLELAYGDPVRAAELYQEMLADDPEDAWAMRSLGVALLMAGRPEDAVATVRLAYVTDPTLASNPLGEWVTGGSSRAMRVLVVDAVRHAQRADSASAWLLVTVLMQAEGRNEVALRQLDKAEQRGLDEQVGLRLRAEMVRR